METSVIIKTKEIIAHKLAERKGNRTFATSSFQTQSVPLLHLLGQDFPEIPILFLDTGFLFAETYQFKEELKMKFGLKVITLKSDISLLNQRDKTTGLFQYASKPDYCCYINKVKPLEDFLQPDDVWISGVRRDQTKTRANMETESVNKNGILKLHPMLHWTAKDIYDYRKENHLPEHPLEGKGYVSIGCVPCTQKWDFSGNSRSGRWVGRNKTECGLHTK